MTRNIEKSIRESEERLHLAIEAGSVGAWEWDIINDRITWSDQIYEFYGIRRGEFDGRLATFERFVHPDDRERVGKLIQRSLARLEPYNAELRIIRPSGELRWHSAHAKVIGDENGRATRLIGACVDITERKRTEELGKAQSRVLEMIARNEPLDNVLNTIAQSIETHHSQMKCGIFLLDSEGRHFHRAFGRSLHSSFTEAVIQAGPQPCKPRQEWTAERLDTEQGNSAFKDEHWTEWLRQLAGDYRFASCLAAPVMGANETCLGAFVMYWNAAPGVRSKPKLLAQTATHLASIAIERMRAEEQLRKRSERSLLLRDSLAELLAAKDPGAVMRNLFPEVAKLLGADIYYNFLVNEEGNALKLVSFAGITPELERHFRRVEFGHGICGTVAQSGQPIIANDIQNSTYDKAADARRIGVQTYACYPLLVEGRVLGTLSFASRTRKSYQEDELEFIRTVAQHTAVALDRQLSAQDLQQELSQRKRSEAQIRGQKDVLEQMVQGASLVEILNTLARIVETLANRKLIATILLAEPRGGCSLFAAGANCPPSWADYLGRATLRSNGTFCVASSCCEPRMAVSDIASDPLWNACKEEALANGLKTCWSVPILSLRGGVLGTFIIYYSEATAPNEEEREAVEIVVRTAAIAIERKQSEEALKRAQHKLRTHADELELRVQERTTKLKEAIEQMEEFSYTVSHDLRAPVRAISGYAKALREDSGEAMRPEARTFLDRIISSSSRMDRLILDVLTYTRLSRREFELQPVSLDKLLRDIIQQYPEIGASEARIVVAPDLGTVIGHEPSLSQAISNLLGNSVKFVARGQAARIHVWSERRENQVRLWVEDNGIGIMPAHQKRLFAMFERVHSHEDYEGTGVGLAIVRKAAERMGGKVGVESDGRSGSRFWIELRAAANNA
jgi:PAS domain S-box-containing protein